MGQAIIESGTYQGTIPLLDAESVYVKVKKHSKCNDAECLEKISTESLRSAFAASAGKTSWGPAVDGVSLEDEPFNLIRHGKYNDKVPIMIGSNRDEMAFF